METLRLGIFGAYSGRRLKDSYRQTSLLPKSVEVKAGLFPLLICRSIQVFQGVRVVGFYDLGSKTLSFRV